MKTNIPLLSSVYVQLGAHSDGRNVKSVGVSFIPFYLLLCRNAAKLLPLCILISNITIFFTPFLLRLWVARLRNDPPRFWMQVCRERVNFVSSGMEKSSECRSLKKTAPISLCVTKLLQSLRFHVHRMIKPDWHHRISHAFIGKC